MNENEYDITGKGVLKKIKGEFDFGEKFRSSKVLDMYPNEVRNEVSQILYRLTKKDKIKKVGQDTIDGHKVNIYQLTRKKEEISKKNLYKKLEEEFDPDEKFCKHKVRDRIGDYKKLPTKLHIIANTGQFALESVGKEICDKLKSKHAMYKFRLTDISSLLKKLKDRFQMGETITYQQIRDMWPHKQKNLGGVIGGLINRGDLEKKRTGVYKLTRAPNTDKIYADAVFYEEGGEGKVRIFGNALDKDLVEEFTSYFGPDYQIFSGENNRLIIEFKINTTED